MRLEEGSIIPKRSGLHCSNFSNQLRLGISIFMLVVFGLNVITPPAAMAQGVLAAINAPAARMDLLPPVGTMVGVSPSFDHATLKGIKLFPDNPFRLEFMIDTADSGLTDDHLRQEANKLIKYFLTTLTVPDEQLWVNLSPYEKDRITADQLGVTEMGRDLLTQDYLLKQVTASLLYPEDDLGKAFWQKIYQKARQLYGTTEIPVNTFNKVWILPERAVVYEDGDVAMVTESRLKVMLEEDYAALNANAFNAQSRAVPGEENERRGMRRDARIVPEPSLHSGIASQIIRELIIPEIEREVNEGKNFANLRQIYHSMILATWFKRNIRDNILGKVYVGQNKVQGVDVEDKQIKEKIYRQYLEAFRAGVYDFIKEEYDPVSQDIRPRKYFSGGVEVMRVDQALLVKNTLTLNEQRDYAQLIDSGKLHKAVVDLEAVGQEGEPERTGSEQDKAMVVPEVPEWINEWKQDMAQWLQTGESLFSAIEKEGKFGQFLPKINNKFPDRSRHWFVLEKGGQAVQLIFLADNDEWRQVRIKKKKQTLEVSNETRPWGESEKKYLEQTLLPWVSIIHGTKAVTSEEAKYAFLLYLIKKFLGQKSTNIIDIFSEREFFEEIEQNLEVLERLISRNSREALTIITQTRLIRHNRLEKLRGDLEQVSILIKGIVDKLSQRTFEAGSPGDYIKNELMERLSGEKAFYDAMQILMDPSRVEGSHNIQDVFELLQKKIPGTIQSVTSWNIHLDDTKILLPGPLGVSALVIENLINNAYVYSPVEISVEARQENGQFIIAVHNGGEGGLDESVWLKPRLGATKHADGYGTGLPLIHYLVQVLGGTLEISSLKGKGTTVTVTLPVVDSDADGGMVNEGESRWPLAVRGEDQGMVSEQQLLALFEEVIQSKDVNSLHIPFNGDMRIWTQSFGKQLSELAQVSQVLGRWVVIHNTEKEYTEQILQTGIRPGKSNNVGLMIYDFTNKDSIRKGFGKAIWSLLGHSMEGWVGNIHLNNVMAIIGDERDSSIQSSNDYLERVIGVGGFSWYEVYWSNDATARLAVDLSIEEEDLLEVIDQFVKRHPEIVINDEDPVKERLKQMAIAFIWMERLIQGIKKFESESIVDGKEMDLAMVGETVGPELSVPGKKDAAMVARGTLNSSGESYYTVWLRMGLAKKGLPDRRGWAQPLETIQPLAREFARKLSTFTINQLGERLRSVIKGKAISSLPRKIADHLDTLAGNELILVFLDDISNDPVQFEEYVLGPSKAYFMIDGMIAELAKNKSRNRSKLEAFKATRKIVYEATMLFRELMIRWSMADDLRNNIRPTKGEILLLYRKYSGLSLEEAADQLGVSTEVLNSWEQDKTIPSRADQDRLSNFYGVELRQFREMILNAHGESLNRVVKRLGLEFGKKLTDPREWTPKTVSEKRLFAMAKRQDFDGLGGMLRELINEKGTPFTDLKEKNFTSRYQDNTALLYAFFDDLSVDWSAMHHHFKNPVSIYAMVKTAIKRTRQQLKGGVNDEQRRKLKKRLENDQKSLSKYSRYKALMHEIAVRWGESDLAMVTIQPEIIQQAQQALKAYMVSVVNIVKLLEISKFGSDSRILAVGEGSDPYLSLIALKFGDQVRVDFIETAQGKAWLGQYIEILLQELETVGLSNDSVRSRMNIQSNAASDHFNQDPYDIVTLLNVLDQPGIEDPEILIDRVAAGLQQGSHLVVSAATPGNFFNERMRTLESILREKYQLKLVSRHRGIQLSITTDLLKMPAELMVYEVQPAFPEELFPAWIQNSPSLTQAINVEFSKMSRHFTPGHFDAAKRYGLLELYDQLLSDEFKTGKMLLKRLHYDTTQILMHEDMLAMSGRNKEDIGKVLSLAVGEWHDNLAMGLVLDQVSQGVGVDLERAMYAKVSLDQFARARGIVRDDYPYQAFDGDGRSLEELMLKQKKRNYDLVTFIHPNITDWIRFGERDLKMSFAPLIQLLNGMEAVMSSGGTVLILLDQATWELEEQYGDDLFLEMFRLAGFDHKKVSGTLYGDSHFSAWFSMMDQTAMSDLPDNDDYMFVGGQDNIIRMRQMVENLLAVGQEFDFSHIDNDQNSLFKFLGWFQGADSKLVARALERMSAGQTQKEVVIDIFRRHLQRNPLAQALEPALRSYLEGTAADGAMMIDQFFSSRQIEVINRFWDELNSKKVKAAVKDEIAKIYLALKQNDPEAHYYVQIGEFMDMEVFINRVFSFYHKSEVMEESKTKRFTEMGLWFLLENVAQHGGNWGGLILRVKDLKNGEIELTAVVLDRGEGFINTKTGEHVPVEVAISGDSPQTDDKGSQGMGLSFARITNDFISISAVDRTGAYYWDETDGEDAKEINIDNLPVNHGTQILLSSKVIKKTDMGDHEMPHDFDSGMIVDTVTQAFREEGNDGFDNALIGEMASPPSIKYLVPQWFPQWKSQMESLLEKHSLYLALNHIGKNNGFMPAADGRQPDISRHWFVLDEDGVSVDIIFLTDQNEWRQLQVRQNGRRLEIAKEAGVLERGKREDLERTLLAWASIMHGTRAVRSHYYELIKYGEEIDAESMANPEFWLEVKETLDAVNEIVTQNVSDIGLFMLHRVIPHMELSRLKKDLMDVRVKLWGVEQQLMEHIPQGDGIENDLQQSLLLSISEAMVFFDAMNEVEFFGHEPTTHRLHDALDLLRSNMAEMARHVIWDIHLKRDDIELPGPLGASVLVFENLIKNAPGGVDVTVSVYQQDQQQLTVEVRDQGSGGIDPLLWLNPRLGATSRGVGHGTGLSLVHYLVEDLGGTMSVDSPPEKGTTVRVTFDLGMAGDSGMVAVLGEESLIKGGGIVQNAPWRKSLDSEYFLSIASWTVPFKDIWDYIIDIFRQHNVRVPEKGVGLNIGFGDNYEEPIDLVDGFGLRKLYAVEMIAGRISFVDSKLRDMNKSSEQYELYHADLKRAIELVEPDSIDVIYGAAFLTKNNYEDLIKLIKKALKPGGIVIIAGHRDFFNGEEQSFIDALGEHGDFLDKTHTVIFQKKHQMDTAMTIDTQALLTAGFQDIGQGYFLKDNQFLVQVNSNEGQAQPRSVAVSLNAFQSQSDRDYIAVAVGEEDGETVFKAVRGEQIYDYKTSDGTFSSFRLTKAELQALILGKESLITHGFKEIASDQGVFEKVLPGKIGKIVVVFRDGAFQFVGYEASAEIMKKVQMGHLFDFDGRGVKDNPLMDWFKQDEAMVAAPGGIDLNPARLDLETQGRGMDASLSVTPRQLDSLIINGLTPVILEIVPVTSMSVLLGWADEGKEERHAGDEESYEGKFDLGRRCPWSAPKERLTTIYIYEV